MSIDNKANGNKKVHEALREYASSRMDIIALVDHGKEISYAGLLAKIDETKELLLRNNIHRGDMYAVLLRTSLNSICLFYAGSEIGAVANVLNYTNPDSRLVEILKNYDVNALLTSEQFVDRVENVCQQISKPIQIIML